MSKPKLSIIIATFNAAKTLSVALDSVLKQSFQDWECIIVDGASKDNTIEIVKSYVEHDSRFRYISEPDKGIYDAFNKGWKMAKGEWIYYLGADDEVLPDAFIEIFQAAIDDYDIIYGDILLGYASKRRRIQSIPPDQLKGRSLSHQCLIMRKNIIETLNGFDLQYRICADLDMVQKAYSKGLKFYYISTPVAVFNLGGISTGRVDNLKEGYRICLKYDTNSKYRLMIRYIYKYAKSLAIIYFRKLGLKDV